MVIALEKLDKFMDDQMYKKALAHLTYCALLSLNTASAIGQTELPALPTERYNSQIDPADYVITQQQKGKWAVNCRQRVQPHPGEKRCSATDGRQILKFKAPEPAPPPAQAFKQATTAEDGYILQLAAFSDWKKALKFQKTHPEITSRIIPTTVQNITLFTIVTPVISDFKSAQSIADKTAATLGYLPWIRTTDSL